ncbi:MAG: tyrosine-type recombinase/integrase [Rhizobiales bacterium]|nr:tyrosine-type recombinase/integrase [Hyphomicrobiales bacterium]
MALTNLKCQNAQPKEKLYRIYDSGGLYLEITTKGGKYWRLKFRYLGREKRLSFGVFPTVSLKDARIKRDEAKQYLANGVNPSRLVKEAKQKKYLNQKNSFEEIAREWHQTRVDKLNPKYANTLLGRLEKDIFTELGTVPINDITAPQLLAVVKKIESRGALDVAKRALQTCGKILRYAVATGRAESDVSTSLKDILKIPKRSHYKYLTEIEMPEFLAKLKKYDGALLTQLAIKFTILTFTRTGEVRGALWSEIDFVRKEWRIPAERMKMNDPHIVPLSTQLLDLLYQLKTLTKPSKFVFPNQSNSKKFMSENTMLFAVYRMGYHKRTTVHGFRATASTILNEHNFRADVIERQLAHAERNSIRAAYNHAQYLPDRKIMMQHWSDFVEVLENGNTNIINGKFGQDRG